MGLMSLFSVLTIQGFWILAESQVARSASERPPVSKKGGTLPTLMGLTVLLVVVTSIVGEAQPNFPVLGLGLLLAGLGIGLRCRAISTLKERFLDAVELTKNHTLCREGIYSVLRHPSELGTTMILLGTIFAGGSSWPSFCLLVCLWLPLMLYRCHREDALIRENLGREGRAYQKSVPALVPTFRLFL